MSRSQFKALKFLVGLIVGALFALHVSAASFSFPAVAQIAPANELIQPLTFQDLAAFQLNARPESLIPATLREAERPDEGSRGIYGDDDRTVMTSRNYPWSTVGRIEGLAADESGYICTGTLIELDVVLTNAHCVIDPETHQRSIAMRFLPNLINGRVQNDEDIAIVESAWAATDFSDSAAPNPKDWAILKLDRPLGEKYGTIGWRTLPIETLVANSDQFALVGYSGDFPSDNPGETAGVHLGCTILDEVDGLLLHSCDTTGGASGGPILGRVDDQLHIVGLHAGAINNLETGEILGNYAVKMAQLEVEIGQRE